MKNFIGEETMKVSVTKLFEFEACHHLPNYNGACSRNHGHSYKLEVEIEGEVDKISGMVMDFSLLKQVVKTNIIDKFDHQDLNTFYDIPTAEVMVVDIFRLLQGCTKDKIIRVRLYETSTSYAEMKC